MNAVRRAAIGDVPTVAFAHNASVPDAPNRGVHIQTNTSAYNNEFMAHRLSLVPIHLAEDELEKTLLDPARLRFSLHIKNTDAAGSATVRIVTTKDIQVRDGLSDVPRPAEFRDQLFPPDAVTGDHILLLRLRTTATGDIAAGEEFAAQLTASPGTANAHARWSPVCQCHLSNLLDPAAVAAALQVYLAHVQSDTKTTVPAAGSDDVARMTRQFMTLQGQRHFLVDRWGDACAFRFVIESTCGMRPEYIVFKALLVLSRRVNELAKRVEALALPSRPDAGRSAAAALVTIDVCDNADDTYIIGVRNEGHTLGNLIQGLLYNRFVRDYPDPTTSPLPFIGYHEPHPLDRRIVFKLSVSPKTDVIALFAEALRSSVVQHLDDVNLVWIEASGLDKSRPAISEVAAWLQQHTR